MGEKSSWDWGCDWEKELPIYSHTKAKHIREEELDDPFAEEKKQREPITKCWWQRKKEKMIRDHALTVIVMFLWGASLIGGCCITGTIMYHNAYEEASEVYEQKLDLYKRTQAEAAQKEYFLSGEASREAFLNQEKEAARHLSAGMMSNAQKGGIVCNAISRLMKGNHGSTLQEVISEANQWMYYQSDRKYTEVDIRIADKLVEDYYNGIIPNGLTDEYEFGSWYPDGRYVLRNTWDFSSNTRTWEYSE